ncbi:SET domain-containing protein [Meredithblackwellia eburnea MCA 4105]
MKRGFLSGNKSLKTSNNSIPAKQAPPPTPATPVPSTLTQRAQSSPSPSSGPGSDDSLRWCFNPPLSNSQDSTATTALYISKTASKHKLPSQLKSQINTAIKGLKNGEPPFTIAKSTEKGLHLTATTDIPHDTLIFMEPPLLVVPSLLVEGTTEEEENRNEEQLAFATQRLQPTVRASVLDLDNVFSGGDGKRLTGTLRTNAYPCVEFPDEQVTYLGLFEIFSRINHSCDPNLLVSFDPTTFLLSTRTNRPVKEGEELTVTYIVTMQKREQRRRELMMKYKFHCECSWCSLPDHLSQKKDDEREAIAKRFLAQWSK